MYQLVLEYVAATTVVVALVGITAVFLALVVKELRE
jgi:hypothetical protein